MRRLFFGPEIPAQIKSRQSIFTRAGVYCGGRCSGDTGSADALEHRVAGLVKWLNTAKASKSIYCRLLLFHYSPMSLQSMP